MTPLSQRLAAGGLGYFTMTVLRTIGAICPACSGYKDPHHQALFAGLIAGAGGLAVAALWERPPLGAAFAVGVVLGHFIAPWEQVRPLMFRPPAPAMPPGGGR